MDLYDIDFEMLSYGDECFDYHGKDIIKLTKKTL